MDDRCICTTICNPRLDVGGSTCFDDEIYWTTVQVMSPELDVTDWPDNHPLWVEGLAEALTHEDIAVAYAKRKLTPIPTDALKSSKIETFMRALANDN